MYPSTFSFNKTRWRALIHFKTKHEIGFNFFSVGETFSLWFLRLVPQNKEKRIPNPQGKENPKGNLMRRNEIGNQVLIFSKIILNNFFVDRVSSCDCFPFSCFLGDEVFLWFLCSKHRCSHDFCALCRGVARVKIAAAGIIWKVTHGGHGRDMQFFSWHAIFRVTYGCFECMPLIGQKKTLKIYMQYSTHFACDNCNDLCSGVLTNPLQSGTYSSTFCQIWALKKALKK